MGMGCAQMAYSTEADFRLQMERDYRYACAALGWMPFDDFAAGYRWMEEWYAQYPMRRIHQPVERLREKASGC